MLRKTTTALALAGVLTFVVAGCGGGDDPAGTNDAGSDEKAAPAADAAQQGGEAAGAAAFCQNAKALYDQLAAAPADPTSSQVQAVFAEAKAMEAPEEIATDWNAILDTLVGPVVHGEIDVNDPAGSAELTSRATGLAESLQRTGTYFDTTCGFGTTTTVAAAPATAAPAPAPEG